MGKVCLIIGGGRGMGAATARQMHSRDYALALMSPTESCETLAGELGGIAQRGRAENASVTGPADRDQSSFRGATKSSDRGSVFAARGPITSITDFNCEKMRFHRLSWGWPTSRL